MRVKPVWPVLQRGHRQEQGLIAAWPIHTWDPATLHDVAGTRPMTIGTATYNPAGEPGVGIDTTVGASVATAASANIFLPTANNCSIVVYFEKLDGTNRASAGFGLDGGATGTRCGTHMPWSDGNIYFDYGGASDGTTRLTVSGQTFEAAVWVFCVGPRGMEAWKDGVRVASNSGTPTRTSSTAGWGLGTHGGWFADDNRFYDFRLYNRQLAEGVCRDLNPDTVWDLYVPRRRLFVKAPVAAAPLDVATITPVPEARGVPPAQRFDLDLAYDGFPAYLEAAVGVNFVKIVNETEAITEGTVDVRALVRVVDETEAIPETTVDVRALVRVVDETEAVPETTVDVRSLVRVVDETEETTETTVDARTMVRVVDETTAIPEADNLAATWLDIIGETEAISETTVISGIPLGVVGPGIRNDTEEVSETVVTVMEAFQDMTFDLNVGGDLMSGMRKVHEDAEYVIYQAQLITSGDAAIQGGFTANKLNAERQIVAMVNYGHKGTETPDPLRQTITASLTWDSGGGSITGIVLDNDQGGAYTVLSGSAIPPLILDWNASSKTQTSRFEGYTVAFVASSMWLRKPADTGVSDRFALRFDPARETTTYSRMMRGTTYGGSWVNDDTWGTRVRPDLLQFHTDNNDAWYKFGRRDRLPPNGSGNGWWLNTTTQPTVTSDWTLYPDSQHADAGFGPFCMAYEYGGKAFWSNTAYHMIIMQIAARWLNQFPAPGAGYAGTFFMDYHNDSMRGVGRILAVGIHMWRALVKMTAWRTQNDTEANTLAAAVGVRWLEIFNHVYHYSKPEALGSEPAPIYGYWQRSVKAKEPSRHPDAGYTVGANEQLSCYQIYQGGLLWQGLLLGYEAMQAFGLTGLREYDRIFQLMRFVALGFAATPGVYTLTFKWKNSHPYEPPSPLPPSWAGAPSWPAAQTYFLSGFGWSAEYYHMHGETLGNRPGNANNTDLRYLSFPSTATFGYACLSLMQWLKRDGILSATKLDEIIADYEPRLGYQWQLGSSLVKVVNETVALGPEAVGDVTAFKVISNPTETMAVVDNTVALSEDVVAVFTSTDVLVKVVSETVAIGVEDPDTPSILYARTRVLFVNTAVELGETLLSAGLAKAIVKVVDETLGVADPDEGVDEVVFSKRGSVNDNTALTGTGTSVNATLTGAGASVNSAKTGTGSSVNTALTGG